MREKIRNGIICVLLIGLLLSLVSCATVKGVERRAAIKQARLDARIARIKSDTLTQPAPAWVYPYIYPQRTWGIGPFYNSFYGHYQRPLVIRKRPNKGRRNRSIQRPTPTRNRQIRPKSVPRTPRGRTGTTGNTLKLNRNKGRRQH